jgi:hypothetical protein
MMLLLGCMRRIVSLVLLVVLALVAWHYRDTIMAKWHELRGAPADTGAASADAARTGEEKLRALELPYPPTRTALSGAELQALLQTRFSKILPRWVDSARIRLEGDRVRLSGRVPVDHLPQIKSLGEVAGLLPDTAEVAVNGQVIPLDHGRVALAVDQVTAAHIPLPRRLIPEVLGGLRKGDASVPPDALPLPLPRSITSAYVRSDSLILMTSAPPAGAAPAAAPRRR